MSNRIAAALLVFIFHSGLASGQEQEEVSHSKPEPVHENLWPESDRFTFKIQATTVTQVRDSDPAPAYAKPDTPSLVSGTELRTSFTTTLFSGIKLTRLTEAYFNPEISAGSGLSDTHGIAGFPNGEIYRVDSPSPKFNLSRLYVKQVINLGGEKEDVAPDINQIKTVYSSRRLTLVGGKFSLSDFFDTNAYSHDPRTQFLNWGLMDNGAWDYAADTKGYTAGLMIEYNQKEFAVRFARVMVPQEANQMTLDKNVADAHGDNLEVETRYSVRGHPGKLRLMGFENHAHMGSYARSLAQAGSQTPDITSTREYRTKYGYGLNFEQEISPDVGAFARLGWNDGRSETWAFTEIDMTYSAGLSWKPFGERDDRVGAAFIVNEISADHWHYLEAGGQGFMLGEGGLNYGPEQILETYYAFKFLKSFAATVDFQYINHPGYNRDRAPLSVGALRLHYEL